jgi:polyhydroxybutyrate depolymerase
MVGGARAQSTNGSGEVAEWAARPTLAGLAAGLGKVRVYHSVRLGLPRPGGCREATTTGSISGAAWSVPFAGAGEWCGQRAQFSYRLGGPTGRQGRLEYRHEPPAAPTATFSGALPAPPAARAARDPARRVDSAGCGRPPPVRPGRSADVEVKADPAVSAGATRRSYRLHVPAGYRPGRAVPAVLLLHGNGGSAADLDDVTGLSALADRRGFLAVYPQGMSVGAGRPFWAAAMACDLAGRVASVAVVSGALYAEPGECRPSRPVPLLDIHGTDDPVVPYGGRAPTVEWPLPMPPVPTWLAGWATRDGCPGEPPSSSTPPRRPASAGAAAATAARSCTSASTAATTRRPAPSPAGPSPRSPGTSSPPTRSRASASSLRCFNTSTAGLAGPEVRITRK